MFEQVEKAPQEHKAREAFEVRVRLRAAKVEMECRRADFRFTIPCS